MKLSGRGTISEAEVGSVTEYLLVDGYNMIYAWKDLAALAEDNLDGARFRLQEILSNYQGMCGCTLILVFDGYKVKGNPGEVIKYHNIYVVYTKEAETADQYIEKTTGQLARSARVRVATSDRLEQVIVLGQGAIRVSARELEREIEEARQQLEKEYLEPLKRRNPLIDNLSPEMAAYLDQLRLKETKDQ